MHLKTVIRMGSILLYLLTKAICMSVKMYKEDYGWGEPWCFIAIAVTDLLMITTLCITW